MYNAKITWFYLSCNNNRYTPWFFEFVFFSPMSNKRPFGIFSRLIYIYIYIHPFLRVLQHVIHASSYSAE